jgi:hypothetical protein
MRTFLKTRAWMGVVAGCVLGCGVDGDDTRGYTDVGDDVERDAWVDTAHPLAGDGATRFASYRSPARPAEPIVQPWRPYFVEAGMETGPMTTVLGDHLLSLSRFRGLVSTRVTGPAAPRLDASVALSGLPVGLYVLSEGVAAVLVLDPLQPGCVADECVAAQTSRLVLLDVQDPGSPRAFAEQRWQPAASSAPSET